MIVGVDETGDFGDGTRAWFAAVLVRPSSLNQVGEALRQWERDTRRRLRLANELKGAQIDGAAGEAFVTDVMAAGDGRSVRWTAFAVDVDEQSYAAMAIQRQILADGYERWADLQVGAEDPDRQRSERQLRHWAAWVRARSDHQMLKLSTLAMILPTLLEWSFGLSIAHGHDEELLDLAFYLDRGYIKASELVIWRDILRNVFIDRSQQRPVPFSAEWPPDHPVLQAFVERPHGDGFVLKQSFKDRIDFYDSATTPIIRMADVVAALIRRGLEGGPVADALEGLRSRRLDSFPYTLLKWTSTVPQHIPNPYLDPLGSVVPTGPDLAEDR